MKKKKIGTPSRFDGTKLCWWCKHFRYDEGSPGYSEVTPGWGASIYCGNGFWQWEETATSQEQFRNYIHHAVDCEKFESTLIQDVGRVHGHD